MGAERSSFERDLTALLNQHSIENESNTADFVLAEYLRGALDLWNRTCAAREHWYGVHLRPGQRRLCTECESKDQFEVPANSMPPDDER